MLLADKNAVIYGAGGSIGSALAATFAHEGAAVFLAGRTRAKLDRAARDINAAGGRAEIAVLDALDEDAVENHARSIVNKAGGIDVSINLIGRGDVQGIRLIDITTADFTRPVIIGMTATFITARAAARHMVNQGSGTILALTGASAHGNPMLGGGGAADAAVGALVRNLSAEIGPYGVRVVGACVSPASAATETHTALNTADTSVVTASIDDLAQLGLPSWLAEACATIAFLASDQATGLTGAFVSLVNQPAAP